MARARASGVERMMVTGGSLRESEEALKLALDHDWLFSTAGCHPTRCSEWLKNPDQYYQDLLALIQRGQKAGKIVAIGECGLDYDRLMFCPADVQKTYFQRQFDLTKATGLPMFLHNRNTGGDMVKILKANRHKFTTGVVHSFDGSLDELQELLALGLYIGINGCSLKQPENLEVLKHIPLDRLMLETDAPWCDIRPTHASYAHLTVPPADLNPATTDPQYPFPTYFYAPESQAKRADKLKPGQMFKSRNEPCAMVKVLSVVANARGESMADVAEATFNNTLKVFFGQL
ncbi:TatD family hydrolase [Allomyces macrogynus ATCC 38327]|uniref:TatD family hydrolase n=1 Tax=Allomyces macrogynus (strain ATCC 38327) TaxID=578462 RepID=A0A0L0S9S1_ALLM3|nr:TatD family hydrolase [Allomyces macrogynus ATCC 38327]|eukprot:KNE59140.1 TatD family hydrolase [Allomyces macrogynus ATCC 38327]